MGSALDRLIAEELRRRNGGSAPALDPYTSLDHDAPDGSALDRLIAAGGTSRESIPSPDTLSLAPRPVDPFAAVESGSSRALAPAPEPRGFFASIGRGLRGGLQGQNVEGTGSFVETIGDLIESERVSGAGRRLEEYGKVAGEPYHPVAGSWRDAIDGPPGTLPEFIGTEMGRGLASSLPSIVGGVAGGLAGASTGPAAPILGPVGVVAGAAAPAFALNTGDVAQELEALGVTDPQVRARAALEIGAVITVPDVLPTSRLAGKLWRTALREKVTAEAVRRGLVPAAGRVAKEGGVTAAAEGLTEGVQEGIQYGATRAVADVPMRGMEALERVLGAAASGGLAGGPLGAGTQTIVEGLNAARGRSPAAPQAPKGPAEPMPALGEEGGSPPLPPPGRRADGNIPYGVGTTAEETSTLIEQGGAPAPEPPGALDALLGDEQSAILKEELSNEEFARAEAELRASIEEPAAGAEVELAEIPDSGPVPDAPRPGPEPIPPRPATEAAGEPTAVGAPADPFAGLRERQARARQAYDSAPRDYDNYTVEIEELEDQLAQHGVDPVAWMPGEPAPGVPPAITNHLTELYDQRDIALKRGDASEVASALGALSSEAKAGPLSPTEVAEVVQQVAELQRTAERSVGRPPYFEELFQSALENTHARLVGRGAFDQRAYEQGAYHPEGSAQLGRIFRDLGFAQAAERAALPDPPKDWHKFKQHPEAPSQPGAEPATPKATPTPARPGAEVVPIPDGRTLRTSDVQGRALSDLSDSELDALAQHIARKPQDVTTHPDQRRADVSGSRANLEADRNDIKAERARRQSAAAPAPTSAPVFAEVGARRLWNHLKPAARRERFGAQGLEHSMRWDALPEETRERVRQQLAAPAVDSPAPAPQDQSAPSEEANDARPVRQDVAGRAEAERPGDAPDPGAGRDAGDDREGGGAERDRGGRGAPERDADDGTAAGQPATGESRPPREAPAESRGDRAEPSPGAVRGDRRPGVLRGGDYRLTDADRIGQGSPKEKIAANLAAIRLLKQIEAEGRPATRDEQAVLVRYTGWGAFPNPFNPDHADYMPALKELLSPEEYAAARGSTVNAHYTSPEVIRAMYEGLGHLGVQGGRFLEPSMGVGNFLGFTPEGWDVRWSGVELDSLTGRIARLVYPESHLQVTGFENTKHADGTFDVIISNVPFGDYQVPDRRYDRLKLPIHNYFFAKALDLVRPGGVVAFVTSRYTMDGVKWGAFRRYVSARAELLGAFRLPNTAFKGNAGTEVVADVIFLRRRLEGEPRGPEELGWATVGTLPTPEGMAPINEYYEAHPEQLVGELHLIRGQHQANEPAVTLPKGADFLALLKAAVSRLPFGRYLARAIESLATSEAAEMAALEAPGHVKEGGFFLRGDDLYQRLDGRTARAQVPTAQFDKVKKLARLIDLIRGVIAAERDDHPEAAVESARKRLRDAYRAFVKLYGPVTKEERTTYTAKSGREVVLTRFPNLKPIREDPDKSFLFALERYDFEAGKATEGDILHRRTIKADRTIEQADTPADALPAVLNEAGRVDLERIGALVGMTPDEAGRALFEQGLIYDDPTDDRWVTADEYLSGDVRAKLVLAQAAAKREPRYQAHVDALKSVIPEDLAPGQISVSLGVPWIPATDYQQFARDLFGRGRATVRFLAHDASWKVVADDGMKASGAATVDFGTTRIDGVKLLELALNAKAPVITDPHPTDPKKRVKNPDATAAAEAKWQAIKDRFEQWLWEDPKRADRLVRVYNDEYNNLRLRQFDGSHLTFPGMAKLRRGEPFSLDTHQVDAVWRILQGHTLLAHVVGAGKTYTMIAGGMEAKRLGLARKPMYVVPNHLVGQFSSEFRELYPSANLLVTDKEDLTPENRKRFQAKVVGSNWDGIVIAHSTFERIPMSLEAQEGFLNEQLDELDRLMREEAERGDRKSATVKDIEKAKKRLLARIAKLQAAWKKDEHLEFETLGVDMLFVDEAHLFKNLWIASRRRGVGSEGAQRSFDLYLKSRHLDDQRPGWGVNFATGTPIANSMAEMFTMQRYLGRRWLRAHGLELFDPWGSTFGQDRTGVEMRPDGAGYRVKTRFAKFRNLPELIRQFRVFADVLTADDLTLPRPPLIGNNATEVVCPPSAGLLRYIESLLERAKKVEARKVDPSEDNLLKVVGDGRHAALDMRFVAAELEDPQGKLAQAAERIHGLWRETAKDRGAQLVFSDIGTPKDPRAEAKRAKQRARKLAEVAGDEEALLELLEEDGAGMQLTPRGGIAGFDVYGALRDKLVAMGIPAKEIAFVHEADTETRKLKLFTDVKDGRVRVLLGSTEKMGAGMNVQDRLVALHHLDAPWRPADVEQREGRILRRGNLLFNEGKIAGVRIFRYVTGKSFDAFMWNTLERKAGMINSVMRGDMTVREVEDVDAQTMDYAQMAASASDNPAIIEKVKIDNEVQRLDRLKKAHLDQQFRLRQEALNLPKRIEYWTERAVQVREDLERREDTSGDDFTITLQGKSYTKRAEAAAALRAALGTMLASHAQRINTGGESTEQHIGTFAGFEVLLSPELASLSRAKLILRGKVSYLRQVNGDDSAQSLLATLEHSPKGLEGEAQQAEREVSEARTRLADLQARAGTPFEKQADLDAKLKRQAELNAELTRAAKAAPDPAAEPTEEDAALLLKRLTEDESGELNVTRVLDLLGLAKERQTAIAPSALPEVEERWQAAKGLEPASIQEKVRQAIEKLKRGTRHFPEIDAGASPLHTLTNELLLEVEHAQSWAQATAYDKVRRITDGLSEAQVDLLTRHFALSDLQKDIEAGLYADKTLPFAYPNPEAVDADLARVRVEVSKDPKVAEAIHRRQQFAGALVKELVAIEQLPEGVLQDDRYYHRQVLEYFNALPPMTQRPGTSAQEARVHRKGFQRARVGGGDFNTRYHEAEFEWVAQAYRILHMVRSLERIQQLADVQEQLKQEAKSLNKAALQSMLNPIEAEAMLRPFAERIGRATGALYQLIIDGNLTLPGFEHLYAALVAAHTEWKNQPRRTPGEGSRPPLQFNHPQWWALLKRLLEANGEGAVQAASIFKAIQERERSILERLGDRYRTWEDLIPEGYTTWQPVKGNFFFPALTIPERALQAILSGEKPLVEADLREMLVLVGPRETWVIPEWLATTMDGFGKIREQSVVGEWWTWLEGKWKQWQLLNPFRALKYNLNNLSGDFDASLLEPGIVRHVRQAAADLWGHSKGSSSSRLSAELSEWMRLRVLDQGLTVAEIPELGDLPAFQRLAGADPKMFMQQLATPIRGYWRHARRLTQLRENIFRLAAARHFLAEQRAGRLPIAASKPAILRALRSPQERAARLSRDLIGDYGDISSGGQYLRDRIFPFFSWQEINLKRYLRIFRNIAAEEEGAPSRGRFAALLGKKVAVQGAKRLLQVNLFFLAAALWNHLFFDDEEEELRARGRNLHLILGRNEDGSINAIRLEGAFADFLEWLHLHDYPDDIRDVVTGTATLKEKFVESARSPLEKIVGLWEPVSKLGAELLTKRATFPTPFDTRPIRDRGDHAASSVSLGWLYRWLTDKPLPPAAGLTQFLLMRTDPGEAAYFGIRQKIADWQEAQGKERGNPNPTQRDNALYFWRKSLTWGEPEKADRWLHRYYALGGTPKSAAQSMKRAHPLGALASKDRPAFASTLSPQDRQMLDLANRWYRNTLRQGGPASVTRTRMERRAAP